jgi:hypothetical protein
MRKSDENVQFALALGAAVLLSTAAAGVVFLFIVGVATAASWMTG